MKTRDIEPGVTYAFTSRLSEPERQPLFVVDVTYPLIALDRSAPSDQDSILKRADVSPGARAYLGVTGKEDVLAENQDYLDTLSVASFIGRDIRREGWEFHPGLRLILFRPLELTGLWSDYVAAVAAEAKARAEQEERANAEAANLMHSISAELAKLGIESGGPRGPVRFNLREGEATVSLDVLARLVGLQGDA